MDAQHRPPSGAKPAGTIAPLYMRILWMAAIWVMSVAALAVVAFAIRLAARR